MKKGRVRKKLFKFQFRNLCLMKKPKRKFGNFCGTLNLGEIGLDHWRGFCGTFKLKIGMDFVGHLN